MLHGGVQGSKKSGTYYLLITTNQSNSYFAKCFWTAGLFGPPQGQINIMHDAIRRHSYKRRRSISNRIANYFHANKILKSRKIISTIV